MVNLVITKTFMNEFYRVNKFFEGVCFFMNHDRIFSWLSCSKSELIPVCLAEAITLKAVSHHFCCTLYTQLIYLLYLATFLASIADDKAILTTNRVPTQSPIYCNNTLTFYAHGSTDTERLG